MIAIHRFGIGAATLVLGGFSTACLAAPAAAGEPESGRPRSGIWVAYSAGGADSATAPEGDATMVVSTGDLRLPIFSVRLRSTAADGSIEADLLTPAGFDRHETDAGRVDEEPMSGDPYSDSQLRSAKLKRALIHHRPILRLRIGAGGEIHAPRSPEIVRHEACARRLLRAAIEAQLAAAEEEAHKREARQQPRNADPARSVAPPVDSASLLLRLAGLSLPPAPGAPDQGPRNRGEEPEPTPAQGAWREARIASHGRAVRSEIDLLSAPDSPAAGICRSLASESDAVPKSDSCIIEGVIDRRDGWPIRLSISRKSEAAHGATEAQYRIFERVAPLQGFVAPPDPCGAGG